MRKFVAIAATTCGTSFTRRYNATMETLAKPWHLVVIRERFTLSTGSIVSLLIAFWLSQTLAIPGAPMRGGTLLQQSAWPIAIGLAWIILIGCSLLTAIFASTVHYEGGLFCASFGAALLSARLGPMRYALFAATGPKVYLMMAAEILLLFFAIAIAWLILHGISRAGWLPVEEIVPPESREPLDQKILAAGMHVVVMTVIVLLLCRSDDKAQTLVTVGLAGYLASLAAYQFVPAQPSAWFLAGPLIVGLVGYITQYFSPWDWMIGDARGYFAALSRPMPLDYASFGVAGSLLGYWTSHRWHHNRAETETAT